MERFEVFERAANQRTQNGAKFTLGPLSDLRPKTNHALLQPLRSPSRTVENSPVLQHWEIWQRRAESRQGRQNSRLGFLSSLAGLDIAALCPAMNRWAIFGKSLRDFDIGGASPL